MNDYHLRFADREESLATLALIGVSDGVTHWSAVDHIGELVLAPAVMDGDSEVVPALIDSRHHLNLRVRTPLTAAQLSEIAAYLVYPEPPRRVWL